MGYSAFEVVDPSCSAIRAARKGRNVRCRLMIAPNFNHHGGTKWSAHKGIRCSSPRQLQSPNFLFIKGFQISSQCVAQGLLHRRDVSHELLRGNRTRNDGADGFERGAEGQGRGWERGAVAHDFLDTLHQPGAHFDVLGGPTGPHSFKCAGAVVLPGEPAGIEGDLSDYRGAMIRHGFERFLAILVEDVEEGLEDPCVRGGQQGGDFGGGIHGGSVGPDFAFFDEPVEDAVVVVSVAVEQFGRGAVDDDRVQIILLQPLQLRSTEGRIWWALKSTSPVSSRPNFVLMTTRDRSSPPSTLPNRASLVPRP